MAGLKVVSTFLDIPEAQIARSLLRQHGILVFGFDHHLAGMAWMYMPAMRGIRLMVRAEDFAVARALLGDESRRIFGEDDEACPVCKSDNIFRPASWILALAAVMTVGLPLLVKSRRRHCRACRHNWRVDEGLLV